MAVVVVLLLFFFFNRKIVLCVLSNYFCIKLRIESFPEEAKTACLVGGLYRWKAKNKIKKPPHNTTTSVVGLGVTLSRRPWRGFAFSRPFKCRYHVYSSVYCQRTTRTMVLVRSVVSTICQLIVSLCT